MLQAVHQKATYRRASSLYCRWIFEKREQGTRLVAVWIDSEMRCFERECVSHSETEAALEEPGGFAILTF